MNAERPDLTGHIKYIVPLSCSYPVEWKEDFGVYYESMPRDHVVTYKGFVFRFHKADEYTYWIRIATIANVMRIQLFWRDRLEKRRTRKTR